MSNLHKAKLILFIIYKITEAIDVKLLKGAVLNIQTRKIKDTLLEKLPFNSINYSIDT